MLSLSLATFRRFFCVPFFVFCASAAMPAQVVINEIHYAPDGVTSKAEFIELYNNSDVPVDLTGWNFNKGITYDFPAGTTLPARGYLVITGDIAKFRQTWPAVPALGPWSGKLANEGELIRLRDGMKNVVDEVEYSAGFPWPTSARGEGPSMELLNPGFDNALGSSWRSSGNHAAPRMAQDYLIANDSDWHYRKGTSEASLPVSAWRQAGFVEDASWSVGQTSIGYGDDDDNTILTDMQNNYSSIFLRKTIDISPGEVPAAIKLSARVDDGCIIWINGVEVKRIRMGKIGATAEPAYNTLAENYPNEATDPGPFNFDDFIILNAGDFLHEGENVIAVQVFNSALNSTDLTFDMKISEYVPVNSGSMPTPGARNSVYVDSAVTPIAINAVEQNIAQPKPGDAVTITATFGSVTGISSAKLLYQKVSPGSYIRKTDTNFTTNWIEIPMTAGTGNTYAAVIPASAQTHRALVRYKVVVTDAGSNQTTVPYADDPTANFAYFVYGDMPAWTGSFNPGSTANVTYSPALLKSLPVYQLIAGATDVTNSQYNGNYNGQRFYGTLVYNGVVYDHIQFANRGEASTYVSGKNKWRFFFYNSKRIVAHDNYGRPYSQPWDKLNLNACASPWAALHRGMGGVEEAVSMRFYELLGMASPKTHFLHFRVVDNAGEQGSTQYQGGNPGGVNGGDLWGLYLAVEQPDGRFLDERALPDGNVYKIEASAGDLKNQGEDGVTDGSDWKQFRDRAGSSDLAWWRANMNMETYYNFRAGNRVLGNVDLRTGFNHYFFNDPEKHWTVIPWDLDMMFIPKRHQSESGYIVQDQCINNVPALKIEFQNRAREILDLMCEDAGASGGQVGQLIDEYARFIDKPAGDAQTWATLDAAMWNKNPRTRTGDAQTYHYGNFYKTPYTDSRSGGTWTRTLTPATGGISNFVGSMKYLVDYATNTYNAGTYGAWAINNGVQYGYGYKFLEQESADTLAPARPATPTYTGTGYIANDLVFKSGAYSGTGTFAAMQFRIAEISAPGIPLYDAAQPRIYEINDVWRSEEIPALAENVKIPASVVTVGHTYRVRARHKDVSGRWSRWSPAVQFVAGAVPAITRNEIVVSEIMYAPGYPTARETADPRFESIKSAKDVGDNKETKEEFEYVEFTNIGTRTLNLGGVSYVGASNKINYTFDEGVMLSPNERILLVKNYTAFAIRYGNRGRIAGTYSTGKDEKMNNNSEQFTLSQNGTIIHQFTYSDSKPWPKDAKNTGCSLELINPYGAPDHNVGGNWRASGAAFGSPGFEPLYGEWERNHPGIGAPLDNPTGDGINNLTKYALGLNPLAGVTGARLGTGHIADAAVAGITGKYLMFEFTRSNYAGDISYAVEFSNDLKNWTTGGVLLESVDNGDGTTSERWRAAQPVSETQNKLFARLRVSMK